MVSDQEFEWVGGVVRHLDEEEAVAGEFATECFQHIDRIDDVLEHMDHRNHVKRAGHVIHTANVERLGVRDRLDFGAVLRIEFGARLRPAWGHLAEGADRSPVATPDVEHPSHCREARVATERIEEFYRPRRRQPARLFEHRLFDTSRLVVDRISRVDLVDLGKERIVGRLLHRAAGTADAYPSSGRPGPAVRRHATKDLKVGHLLERPAAADAAGYLARYRRRLHHAASSIAAQGSGDSIPSLSRTIEASSVV